MLFRIVGVHLWVELCLQRIVYIAQCRFDFRTPLATFKFLNPVVESFLGLAIVFTPILSPSHQYQISLLSRKRLACANITGLGSGLQNLANVAHLNNLF